MAFPQGINFRQTAGFVTDGATEDPELGNTADYPRVTAQGNNVGWETSVNIQTRDEDAGVDRRLAGLAFSQIATDIIDFRIDLPSAGTYNISLAAGDAANPVDTKVELFDTNTSLGVLCSGNTGAAGSFKDATNTILTAANWPGSNTSVQKTFATTICRFRSGDGVLACGITHVNVAAAAATGAVRPSPSSPSRRMISWSRRAA